MELAGLWPIDDVPEFDGQRPAVGEVADCCEIRRHYGTNYKRKKELLTINESA